MFYASRRGPATLSRVFRATSTNHSIPFTRPSTLSLSLQSITKPSIESRWLHVSSQLRNRAAEAGRPTGERPEGTHVPVEVTKFDELIEHKLVHPNVVNEITRRMGHHTMTQVQSMSINQALQGDDM
jgi:ATP-dependent RNA helicase MSS116